MKIAYVYDTIAPFYHGGYEARGFEMARHLADRGHDVSVLTRAPEDRTIDGVRFQPISRFEPTFDSSGYRNIGGAVGFTFDLLKASMTTGKERFDVVDCNATPFVHVPAAKVLARRAAAPLVLTSHEALRSDLARYAGDRRLGFAARLGLRAAYETAHRMADTIVASAPSAARGLAAEGWGDVQWTAGGISGVGAPRAVAGRRFVSLCRLAAEKRVDTTLRAFGIVASADSEATLLVIGDGPVRDALEQLAAEVGAGRVRFAGAVDEATKQRLLQEETDCYVSASRREGLSVATLEAMARGCVPVISTDPNGTLSNGAADYVKHRINGMVTDGSVEGLAEAMLALCRDPETVPALSERAVQTSREFTWSAAAADLEKIYSQAVLNRRGAR